MNALVLLAIAAIVFALGYRYFARFLAAITAAPADGGNYSTAAQGRTEGVWAGVLDTATLAARGGIVLALAGVGSLAAWGWSPGFLWILVAGLLVAGTYAIVAAQRATFSGPWPSATLYGFGLTANAFTLLLFAGLLKAAPSVAGAYLYALLGSAVLAWQRDRLSRTLMVAGVAGVAALATWLGTAYPVAILGAFRIATAIGPIDLGPVLAWAVLILADLYLKSEQRRPILDRLAGINLLALTLLALLGVLFWHPSLSVPAFRTSGGDHAMPGLILAFSGLPLVPVYLYWIYHRPAPQGQTQAGGAGSGFAPYALVVALTALATIGFLAVVTLSHGTEPGPQGLLGLGSILAGLAEWLSVRAEPARLMLTFTGLALATGLRAALAFGVEQQSEATRALAPSCGRFGARATLVPLVLAFLVIASGTRESWALFSGFSIVFVGVFLWSSTSDRRGPVALIALAALVVADWALLARVIEYWHERRGLGVLAAVLILAWQATALWPRPGRQA